VRRCNALPGGFGYRHFAVSGVVRGSLWEGIGADIEAPRIPGATGLMAPSRRTATWQSILNCA
jgi:hypothetical protein